MWTMCKYLKIPPGRLPPMLNPPPLLNSPLNLPGLLYLPPPTPRPTPLPGNPSPLPLFCIVLVMCFTFDEAQMDTVGLHEVARLFKFWSQRQNHVIFRKTTTYRHILLFLKHAHCKDTIPKILNKYSQKWNCMASFPIPTFMSLWAIYIFPGSVCLFGCSKIYRPIMRYVNRSQIQYMNVEIGRQNIIILFWK